LALALALTAVSGLGLDFAVPFALRPEAEPGEFVLDEGELLLLLLLLENVLTVIACH
jgi:hypothetical protein